MSLETLFSVAHPWHCDRMGHMNVRHYAAMFDDASFHLLGHIEAGDRPEIGWADVRCEIEYRHETPAGTLLAIRSSIVKLGRTSLSYRHVMSNRASGQVHAEAVITTVRFDLSLRKSIAIEADIRQRAEAMLSPDCP